MSVFRLVLAFPNLMLKMWGACRLDVVHFSKNIFSKNSNRFFENFSKNIEKYSSTQYELNLYFLTIVFGSKRPLLRYNMTIDYECKNISMKYHNRFS
jgi:hypothetical protein